MDHVPNANKNMKGGWRIVSVIIIIILISGCIIGLEIKRKSIQYVGNGLGKQAVESVFSIELEKQYVEFEKLFRKHQDDIKKLAKELLSRDLLGQKDYLILFDEEWYLEMQWSNPSGNEFLYSNNTFKAEGSEELVGVLNENTALQEVLNSIIEKGVIIEICGGMADNIWKLDFIVDTKFTSFITGNNGVVNAFVYCEDEECEKYGNRKIEDNWYLWISPAPE